MYRYPACTKTLKWRQPNERNVTGSSITIYFHSRWGKQKNLSKSTKNVRNFTDVIRCINACSNFKLFTHTKAKAWVFPTRFAVILSAVALPIVLKAEFNLELICTLSFLFSKVQAAALNPLSVFKTLLKGTDRLVFVAVEGGKNYSHEKFEGSVHLDLPFWGHLNID